jgi:signal peptidase I
MRRYLIAASVTVLLGAFAVYVANPYGVPTSDPLARMMGYQHFRVPNPSMEPVIPAGSNVKVCFDEPERFDIGDIVLFRTPGNVRILQLKRIAALARADIDIGDGGVFVDGQPIGPWFVVGSDGAGFEGHFDVPEASAFVLGDNLAWSNDSRFFGPVPIADLLGRLCDE